VSRFLVVLGVGLLVGCAAGPSGQGYYETTRFDAPPVKPGDRAALIHSVRGVLAGRALLVRTGRRQASVQPEQLGLAALRAVFTMGDDAFWGAEADLRIAVAQQPAQSVTIRVDASRIEVELGRPLRPLPVPRFDVSRRYNIGPLVEQGARWSGSDRAVLAKALSALSASERKVLQGVPFFRSHGPPNSLKGGHYQVKGCEARLVLFDSGLATERRQFAGPASAPLPTSVRTVLHEVGHALHAAPGRRARCAHEGELARFRTQTTAHNARVAAVSARIRRFNAGERTPAESAAIQSEQASIGQERSGLDARHRVLEADRARLDSTDDAGPVIAAYKRVWGDRPAPTPYGRESPSESFAEAFSLYRVDPDALRRLAPDVLAWFEQGRHLL
jgi:hypothetical protein